MCTFSNALRLSINTNVKDIYKAYVVIGLLKLMWQGCGSLNG